MADIELVIKIDEDYYEILKNGVYCGDDYLPIKIIANGTPLPKGHGRLIDADALPLNAIDDANYGSNYIRIAPTIIEADKEVTMTNQEAIKILDEYKHCFWDKLYEPICMAIKALERQDKLQHALDMERGAYNALVKNIQCEDAISRQAVLNAIMANNIRENEYNLTSSRIKEAVEDLPSVNPQEPKTGRWIMIYLTDTSDIDGQCSECGFIHKFIDGHTTQYNYCPNCGARMVEPQESEE